MATGQTAFIMPRDASERPGGGAASPRVLVIDDDAAVAQAVGRMLRGRYEVVPMTSARDALSRLASGERFDAVICDMTMPDLSGAEVHRQVALTRPELAARIVFVSGGTSSEAAARFFACVPNARLQKPFDRATLLRTLAGVLASA
jgi:CheY-like chemotaxis protein